MLAATLMCLVVGITDGDTLRARCDVPSGYKEYRVRIHAIDAPESRQDFGTVSRKSLSDLCYKQKAVIYPDGSTSYDRIVAAVKCNGKDVATHQVSTGMAWVATKYAANRQDLYPLQANAKRQKIGLWSQSSPTPPWSFRHK